MKTGKCVTDQEIKDHRPAHIDRDHLHGIPEISPERNHIHCKIVVLKMKLLEKKQWSL